MDLYRKNKRISSIFIVIILVIASFGMAHFAWAGAIDKAVSFVVGAIASLILVICGWILGLAISGIITIVSYNNFINEPSIVQAWVVVRDLCNMFFILILLLISFATILRIETYQWKKILPKLLIMAVLINFSKTICGLLIDFSQVIMLTFTNAFSDGGGNFVKALRVKDFLAVTKNQASWWDETNKNLNLTTTVAAMMFVIILMVVATVALLAIMIVFLMRMIMLWIYIILSPFAFLLMAFPAGQKYASQWWSEFVKYLINGPILAFFIWLTLIVMNQAPKFENSVFFDKVTGDLGGQSATIQALQTGTFISFILAIGMLVGGLMISQQIGGLGAAWGMGTLGNLKSKGLGLAKAAAGVPLAAGGWAAKGLFFKAGRIADELQMKGQKKFLGLEMPKSMNYRMIASGWKADREKKMADYESGVLTKSGPLNTMWQETFNKHMEFKQYGTVRKSRTQLADEAKEKKKLDFENSTLNKRVDFNNLSEGERREEIKKWQVGDGKKLRINAYKEKGYDDKRVEDEIAEDEAYLFNKDEDITEVKEKISANKKIIEEYEDPRKTGFRKPWMLSKGKASPYDYVLSKAGDKEREDKEKRAMEARTQQRSFAVNGELIKAFNNKENDKLVSAFKILTQNNDLNEALKDGRIIDIMTRQNGILEKMAKKGEFGTWGEKFKQEDLGKLQEDFRKNPVTPANAQAMVRGMLDEIGVGKKKAARISNDIGEVSFTAGNGLLFGSALGDMDTGEFEFEKLKYEDGKLQSSNSRMAAIAGKYTNLETQQKMRMVHPDIFIAERPDGSASGLTEDGLYFLENSLHGNDLTQMNRLRSDVVKKIANSPQVLNDIKKLINRLNEGTEAQKQQAKHIKYFTGYILQKVRKGEDKDRDKIEKAYDEFIG